MVISWEYISHCCWFVPRLTLISGCLNGFRHCNMESLYFILQVLYFLHEILQSAISDHWLQRKVCKDSYIKMLSFKWQLLQSTEKKKTQHFGDYLESYLPFLFLYFHILMLLFKDTYSVAELHMYILWYTKQAVLQAGLHCSNSYGVTFSSWRLYV